MPYPLPKSVKPSPDVAVMPIEEGGTPVISDILFLIAGIIGDIFGRLHSIVNEI